MNAVQIHGAKTLRWITDFPEPPPPAAGEVLLRVGAVGLCGSDLHLYETGQIGGIGTAQPFVPGHEFMGEVLAVSAGAHDGFGGALQPGRRIAVEPHLACGHCEWCERGDPNLCPHHRFIGLPGADGALRQRLVVPARNCFPIPDSVSDAGGALLETLGVALHAMDLAKGRFARSAVVIGCGPVGLLLVRLARLAGFSPLIAIDPLAWRTPLARAWGATHTFDLRAEAARAEVAALTRGRGVDVVFEVAWAGDTVAAAADMATPGARLVLVGIPAGDDCRFNHSVARRKGLTVLFSRRMKHVYGRAITLATGPQPQVDLDALVTHRFPLAKTAEAFACTAAYANGLIKTVVLP